MNGFMKRRLYERNNMRDGNYDFGSNRDYRREREYRDSQRDYRDRDYSRSYPMPRYDYGYNEESVGRFNDRDIEHWKYLMNNEDGSRGLHFSKDQFDQMARQYGIDTRQFGEDVLMLATNMMYSDYCKVARHYGVDTPEFYLKMAKAFLEDKDYNGTPEEKLWTYYKCIVSDEE